MEKKALGVKLILVQVIILVSIIIGYEMLMRKKTVYVDSARVFNEFRMKKELENNFNSIQMERKNYLDSVELRLKLTGQRINESKTVSDGILADFDMQKEEFFKRKQEFEEMDNSLMKRYNDQIWDRIHQYAKEYGAHKRYAYIFGLTEASSILYANEGEDITQEFIKVINSKYEGR
ncbi:MAG: OmpH family outer membrane protein [Bacteroidota bacterium]